MTRRGTLSIWQDAGRHRVPGVDVAVVGAGIIGMSTAYWITKLRPGMRVVVIEASRVGAGASGRNAGFLLQGHATSYAEDVDTFGPATAAMLWQFTLDNRDLILETFDADRVQARPTGSLIAAGSVAEARRLERSRDLLDAAGFATRYHPEKELNAALGSRAFFGALEVPTGTVIDPIRLLRAIRQSADLEIVEGAAVTAIESDGGGCRLETDQDFFHADRVIVAVNAATSVLLPEVTGHVVPRRAQMFSTEPLEARLAQPVYSHEGYYYIRQLTGGEILVGGARHLHVDAEVGYEDATTVALQRDLSTYLSTHFPWASNHKVRRRWSGTMGFTSDRMPRAGHPPDRGPVTWIGGFSGHGMSMGFLIGRVLAEYTLGSEPHPMLKLILDRAR